MKQLQKRTEAPVEALRLLLLLASVARAARVACGVPRREGGVRTDGTTLYHSTVMMRNEREPRGGHLCGRLQTREALSLDSLTTVPIAHERRRDTPSSLPSASHNRKPGAMAGLVA